MSSMPERDMPGQQGSAQQDAPPGGWTGASQGPAPQQPQPAPGQHWGSQEVWGGQTAGGGHGGWGGQTAAGGQTAWDSPVHVQETRVTGRRVFQYWIDAFLVSIVPSLVTIPFDRSGSTLLHILGGLIYVALIALIGLWYWVIRPHSHGGQTLAMHWFGLRVISKGGGPVNMAQLFIRWIGLLIDSAPWVWPFTGLLGLIVMLGSRYRQRIGDHAARTLVVDARYGRMTGPGQHAGAGTSGMSRQL